VRASAAALVLLAGGIAQAAPAPPAWQVQRRVAATERLRRNVSPAGARKGAVIAAPRGNPEYQFHWTRDAAIVMRELEHDVDRYKDYVRFSWRTIRTRSQAGQGEPKFQLDGAAFRHEWGRPQTDGAGLRALGNISFAGRLLERGDDQYVRTVLYNPQPGARSILREDLDYVAANWRRPSYDVWEEELSGSHFYTRVVQCHALKKGAALARRLGDLEAPARYLAAEKEIEEALAHHWDGRFGIMRNSLDHRAGIEHKWTGLDSSVILAVNHTYPGGPFSPLDERILSTAALLESDFQKKYPINQRHPNAPAIGRYPEDQYTGQPGQNRPDGGNPWVVTTHGFAEFYFRVARELGRVQRFAVTRWNRPFLLAALGQPEGSARLPVGTVLKPTDPRLVELRRAVADKGDAFLEVVRQHTGLDGGQSEQFQRDTGFMTGAAELSWNHASFLSAQRAREEIDL
jgi:glucoamylase